MTNSTMRGRLACWFAALFLVAGSGFVGEAEAKVVVKRTTVYVATLPTGCVKTIYDEVVVWRCGTTYYQAYDGRYVVVTIN